MKATVWLGMSGIRHVQEAALVQAFFDWVLVPSEIKTCANQIGIKVDWMGEQFVSFYEVMQAYARTNM